MQQCIPNAQEQDRGGATKMGAEYHHPVYTEPTEARHDTSAMDV